MISCMPQYVSRLNPVIYVTIQILQPHLFNVFFRLRSFVGGSLSTRCKGFLSRCGSNVMEPETAGVFMEPETTGVFMEPETTGVFMEPETTGVFMEPETAGVFMEPETAGVFMEPETAGVFMESETASVFWSRMATV